MFSQSLLGQVIQTPPCRKGLLKNPHSRVDEAEGSIDGYVSVLEGFENGIDLPSEAPDKLGSISIVDVEALVGFEQSPDVSLLNLSLVVFRIDDPDARRGDGYMVDVGMTSGNPPVVEKHRLIVDGLGQEGGQASLPIRSLHPRFC